MEENFNKTIGELIRNQRRARDYSQEYMAKKLAISQSVYSQIESGKVKCSLQKMVMICKLLEIDLRDMWMLSIDFIDGTNKIFKKAIFYSFFEYEISMNQVVE